MVIEGMQMSSMGEQVMSDALGSALVRARELLMESPEEACEFLARARTALDELQDALARRDSSAYFAAVDLAVLSQGALALVAQADACGDLD